MHDGVDKGRLGIPIDQRELDVTEEKLFHMFAASATLVHTTLPATPPSGSITFDQLWLT